MHCYLGNLITIAECFCKISKKSAVTRRFWGLVVISHPSSSSFFLEKLLVVPSQTIWTLSRTESSAWSSPTLFTRRSRALSFATACSDSLASTRGLRMKGKWERRGRKEKKTLTKKTHYCRPDGNIPHDQTNQSPRWGAGATQPCSNTPFHSLSGTNTWSPINGTPRTWGGGSLEPYWSMPDDFIITHHFIHWRIQTSILITFPRNRSCCAY